jgi:hypothetical protein
MKIIELSTSFIHSYKKDLLMAFYAISLFHCLVETNMYIRSHCYQNVLVYCNSYSVNSQNLTTYVTENKVIL